MASRLKAVPCKITRGSFSGEKMFHITLADGQAYTSLSSYVHLLKSDKTPLEKQEPADDLEIEGYVAARLLNRENGNVIVEIPDGELVMIAANNLVSFPRESKDHVSVGS